MFRKKNFQCGVHELPGKIGKWRLRFFSWSPVLGYDVRYDAVGVSVSFSSCSFAVVRKKVLRLETEEL